MDAETSEINVFFFFKIKKYFCGHQSVCSIILAMDDDGWHDNIRVFLFLFFFSFNYFECSWNVKIRFKLNATTSVLKGA